MTPPKRFAMPDILARSLLCCHYNTATHGEFVALPSHFAELSAMWARIERLNNPLTGRAHPRWLGYLRGLKSRQNNQQQSGDRRMG
jgi:hypothetical protein